MRIAVITLLFCVSLGANALGQDAPPPIVGVGTAIDTDVIAVGGERIFLFGIEAFEKEQMCFLNGRPWACGAVAFRELQIILAEGEISCVRRKDSNRRRFRKPWATCHLNGADIAEQLARRGMALAMREQSTDYVAAEQQAESTEAGIWKSIFVPPWTYRDNLRGM